MDQKHVVFGRVLDDGLLVIRKIESVRCIHQFLLRQQWRDSAMLRPVDLAKLILCNFRAEEQIADIKQRLWL